MSAPPPPSWRRPTQVMPAPDRLASVRRSEQDGVIIAAVEGEIDASNAADIGRELTDITNEARGLVVDLGQVGHLDSTGIALLYELHIRLGRRGQTLAVVAPAGGAARRVLELTAFDTRAVVTGDVDGALLAARASGDPPLPGDPR